MKTNILANREYVFANKPMKKKQIVITLTQEEYSYLLLILECYYGQNAILRANKAIEKLCIKFQNLKTYEKSN